MAAGEVLFREGDPADYRLLRRRVRRGRDRPGLRRREPRDRGPWQRTASSASSTCSPARRRCSPRSSATPGEVIQVPVAELLRRSSPPDEDALQPDPAAFLARRSILIELGAGVRVIGSRFSRDTRRLREFLRAQPDALPVARPRGRRGGRRAAARARRSRRTRRRSCIAAGGVLRNPTNAELAAMLGLGARGAPPRDVRPGDRRRRTGRAGGGRLRRLGGARHAGDRRGRVRRPGEHLGADRELPRLPDRHLRQRAGRARDRCRRGKFGARLVVPAPGADAPRRRRTATSRSSSPTATTVNGRDDDRRDRRPATAGSTSPDLERFEGGGVFYAATQAEAQLCAGDPVVIVGGGNSAGQAAMFLSQHAAD